MGLVVSPGQAVSRLFSDDFGSDTRANYTYLNGASTDVGVSGGTLTKATTTRVVMRPTILPARKNQILKLKLKPVATGSAGNGLAFAIDGTERVHMVIDPSTGVASIVCRGATVDSETITGFGAGNYYWLLGHFWGNDMALHVCSDDPEPPGLATIVASCAAKVPTGDRATIGKGIAKYASIHLNADTAPLVDEFKVWSVLSHPFDI